MNFCSSKSCQHGKDVHAGGNGYCGICSCQYYYIDVDKTDDLVNHPKHYTSHPSGVECIQITEHMNFCLGNALKYIWRADEKGLTIEDLEKAIWYINREIQRRKPTMASVLDGSPVQWVIDIKKESSGNYKWSGPPNADHHIKMFDMLVRIRDDGPDNVLHSEISELIKEVRGD